MKVLLSILLILAIGITHTYCQEIFVSEGKATVKLEDHLSREETRDLAREQAKHEAIEKMFGSQITKDAFVDIENGTQAVTIKSDSEVKGEWLKTTKESFKEETRKVKNESGKGWNTEIWITCEIKGKVREITTPQIKLDFHSLNCPDIKCATTDFSSNDPLYLQFRSPVNGYLAIYLADKDHAYRILPYSEMSDKYLNNVPVEADREYIFFDPSKRSDYFRDFPYYYTDEITLDTEQEQEFYKMYLIFSEKPFSKPILEEESMLEGDYRRPKNLSKRHFDVWIQDSRIFDPNFHYQSLNMRVRK